MAPEAPHALVVGLPPGFPPRPPGMPGFMPPRPVAPMPVPDDVVSVASTRPAGPGHSPHALAGWGRAAGHDPLSQARGATREEAPPRGPRAQRVLPIPPAQPRTLEEGGGRQDWCAPAAADQARQTAEGAVAVPGRCRGGGGRGGPAHRGRLGGPLRLSWAVFGQRRLGALEVLGGVWVWMRSSRGRPCEAPGGVSGGLRASAGTIS